MGLKKKGNMVYIIDFGLAKRYRKSFKLYSASLNLDGWKKALSIWVKPHQFLLSNYLNWNLSELGQSTRKVVENHKLNDLRDNVTSYHIPYKENKSLTGTARYSHTHTPVVSRQMSR